jgi:hypothetical protein
MIGPAMTIFSVGIGRPAAIDPLLLRVAGYSALGLFLTWQIVTRTLAAYLAHGAPASALALDSSQPAALIAAADRRVAKARTSGDAQAVQEEPDEPGLGTALSRLARPLHPIETASTGPHEGPYEAVPEIPGLAALRRSVERALARDPLNVRALRLLGQLALETRDEEAADRLMAAAARRSLRESPALYWLMHRSYARKDPAGAIGYADALLRSRTRSGPYVMPLLGRMLAQKEAREPLIQALSANPPWRSKLFASLEKNVPDARAPLDVLMALEDSSAPATQREIASYLDFLARHKHYELAYYAWLQFLTPEDIASAGRLFNGSFERQPSGLPFDWRLKQGNGVTVDRVARDGADGQHALAIELGHGRVDFSSVEQMTLLPPGVYRLAGEHKGQISGRRGFVWRVVCAENGMLIGQSPMLIGMVPKWREIRLDFTVPGTGCRAQMVRLVLDARSPSEQMVSGSIVFDELSITRLP